MSPPEKDPPSSYIISYNNALPVFQPTNINTLIPQVDVNIIDKMKNGDMVINELEDNRNGENIYFYKDKKIYPTPGYPSEYGNIPPWINIRKQDCGYSYFNKIKNSKNNQTYNLSNKLTPLIVKDWKFDKSQIYFEISKELERNYSINNSDDYEDYDDEFHKPDYNTIYVKKQIYRPNDNATANIFHKVYLLKNLEVNDALENKIINKVDNLIIKYFKIEETDFYHEEEENNDLKRVIYLDAIDRCTFKLRNLRYNKVKRRNDYFNPIIIKN